MLKQVNSSRWEGNKLLNLELTLEKTATLAAKPKGKRAMDQFLEEIKRYRIMVKRCG
jgi:hypothetical protein